MRNDLRDAAVVEVRSRIVAACIQQAALPDGLPLDVLINETLYFERKRLTADKTSPTWAADLAFWDDVKSRLSRAGEAEMRRLLERIVDRFVGEIVGNFNPWVYSMATRVLPKGLPMLLNAISPKRLLTEGGLPDIGDTIRIQGQVGALRRSQERGTVILTPTHVSNLDSPVIGWMLYAAGLPPFTYGAGLNLFSNPMIAFFMRNLGAYRVDRMKQAPLYKDVLKEYATVSMELGQSNLFFPAGTRVRSGEVEQHLKLGLMSSGLRAYIQNLRSGKAKPNVYVVPVNLNYHLVLEAETLIEEHLRKLGKSRYIITDDESSRPRKVYEFLRALVNLDGKITVTVGDPIDPFGNAVDEEGESLDPRGRRVDIRRYVQDRDGTYGQLPQRDRVYTTECGEAVARAFRSNNVVLTTNLVAFAMFQHLKAVNPEMDLYRLLRTGGDGAGVEMGLLADRVRRIAEAARKLSDQGRIRMDETVAGGQPTAIIADALKHFGTYHATPVLARHGDRVFAEDMNLLLYYQNRLVGYRFEQVVAEPRGGAARSEEEAA